MENLAENRLAQEKNFFLSTMKKNPVFLLRHFRALSGVVLERCKVKFLTKMRGPYRSNKIMPSWLRGLTAANQSQCTDLAQLVQRIPQFQLNSQVLPVTDLTWETHVNDPEVFFAQQRWGVLTDQLLSGMHSSILPDSITSQMQQDIALETYSTCERIANLLNWITAIPRAKRLTALTSDTIVFLEKAQQWVLNHLEFYGKRTGNHILNNARSLIMVGTVLQNARAVATGQLIFQHCLPVLIQTNGFLRERSSHYQLIVLGWLLDAYIFLQATEYCPPEQVEFLKTYIDKMRSAAALLCDEKGNLQALIGDVSPDLSPAKTSQRLSQYHADFWPTSNAARLGWHDDWCVLQEAANKVILNCPAGRYPKPFSSHAHNDITSFVWLYQGEAVLVDSGRARYTKDPIATLQKSAYGHSVPLVNDFAPLSESLVINGNWWPTPYAKALIQIASASPQHVSLTHNGFQRATPVTKHQRQIKVTENALVVEDFFNGQGIIDLELRWQLAPGFIPVAENQYTNGNLQLDIDVSSMHIAPLIEYHASVGKISQQYGVADSHPVLTMHWQVELPFTTTLVFKVQSCVA